MIRHTRLPRFLLLTVMILLAAGCAVTKIDVDVYKGPLANHKDVQMQQMSVMAIGAKPLLIQLRDHLELQNRRKERSTPRMIRDWVWERLEPRKSLRKTMANDYRDGFIAPYQSGELVLTDENAIRVNAVLSLYENRRAGDPNDLYEQAQAALADYTLNWNIFWGGDRDAWRKQWAELAEGMRSQSDEPDKTARQELKQLKEAFRQFFVPEKDDYYRHPTRQIYDAWPYPIDSTARDDVDRDAEREYPGTNASFLALSDPSVVEEYAGRLYPDDAPQKARFVRDVTSIASAFLRARAALRRMLRINLARLTLFEAAGSVSARSDSDVKGVKEATIELVVMLTRRKNFRALIQAVQASPRSFSSGLRELQQAVAQEEKSDPSFLTRTSPDGYIHFLTELLRTRTVFAASALLEADRVFASKDFPTDRLTGRCRDFIDHRARRFGLIWIPLEEGKTLIDEERPQSLALRQGRTRFAGTAGFARGRLDPGLETLIEEYLKTVHHGSSSAASLSEAKKKCLLEALVRFATKVLFIADHSELLSGTGGSAGKGIEEYVLVLQAVGNSILVQADELRHDRTHRDKAADNATTELNALEGALPQDCEAVLGALISELLEREAQTAAKLKRLQKKKDAREAGNDPGYEALAEKMEKVKREHDQLTHAVEKIREARCRLLDELGTCEGDLAPAEVIARLCRILRSTKKAAAEEEPPENDEVAKCEDALAVLGEIPVPMAPDSVVASDAASDEEVMDRLMATLRQEHIQAVHMYGKDSPTAERIEAALAAAATHRAGMAYIRPPSAYLRSSYPASSLQSDPGLAWSNMLREQGFRSVLGGDGTSKARRRITAEIDKQFWQNINSVRVSGGGRTNYVIAKDDIGNWYVKAYSTDPQDIIKSAQGLALYSMGGAMGTDLLGRLDANSVSGESQSQPPQGSWRQQGFEAFRQNYHKRAIEDRDALKKLAKGLDTTITKSWEDNGLDLSEIKGVLEVPQDRLTAFTDALPDEPAKEALGHTVIDQLRQLMHFEQSVNMALRTRIEQYRTEIDVQRRSGAGRNEVDRPRGRLGDC